jgi:uncharacterized RDD family membrane protein YckC
MRTTELNKKNRLVSMLLDHTIMTFIIFFLEAPVIVTRILSLPHTKVPLPNGLFQFSLYDIFAFALYFNKDLFLGQSIAKRILGFQVFNNKTGQPAGPLRCLARNFTILLWPIEVIAAMINIERRIGDHIAGTRLGVSDPGEQARPNWVSMAVCIPLAIGFTYVAWFYPVELLMNAVISHMPY